MMSFLISIDGPWVVVSLNGYWPIHMKGCRIEWVGLGANVPKGRGSWQPRELRGKGCGWTSCGWTGCDSVRMKLRVVAAGSRGNYRGRAADGLAKDGVVVTEYECA